MDFQSILNQALSGGAVNQMSQVLGTDESKTNTAVQVALPLLLGALTKNSSTPEGPSSLMSAVEKDHDGSILDNLGSFLGGYSYGPGQGILGHVFGNKLGQAQDSVSQSSGLDSNTTLQLLMMLAPIVMGALGRSKQQSGVDEGSLAEVLGGATKSTASDPSMLDMVSQLLDSDRDGSALDDIAKLAGNLFGGKR